MIIIEKIPERELQRIKKKTINNFWAVGIPMVLGALCFGFICNRMDVAIGVILLGFFIFFIVSRIAPITWIIKGDMKIVRRNTVVDARLKHAGYRTKTTTIHLTLAADEIPAPYTQTDTFMVYNSWGHPGGITSVTPDNYKQLIGKPVEITYMGHSGFVIGLMIHAGEAFNQ